MKQIQFFSTKNLIRSCSFRNAWSLALGLVLLVVAEFGIAAGLVLMDELRNLYKRPAELQFPASSPYSPQVATLGKMLFFDPRLSRATNMSCASCHDPSFGWETPAATAIGALNVPLDRHVPTVINLADAPALFWDGRASSLEEQAVGPITNPLEMNMDMDELVVRLHKTKGYREWFDALFPEEGVSTRTIQVSLATFQRTLQSGWSDFDDWVEGNEKAVSETAKRGFALFNGKALCAACHTGWSFTNHDFYDIGLETDDIGRAAIDDSRLHLRHAFKTPTLRNIQLRAPFMHHGALETLEAVIEHYDSGGIARESRSPIIRPLGLTAAEKHELLSFLRTLTERRLDVSKPVLPAE